MEPLELKIFGYTFQINAPKDKHQFYRSIAEKLNDMMVEESTKSDVKSDSKTAIKVAFLLAVESNNSKKQLQEMEKIVSEIEKNLNSLQTI